MGKKVIDETGHRYGRLTVIERAGSDERGRVRWLCKCDCGTEKVVRGESLRWGGVKSCGCLRKDSIAIISARSHSGTFIDETGNRYGRLTVIRKGSPTRSGSKWVCQCDCGNWVEVAGSSLRTGNTKSCGCYRIDRNIEVHGWIK